MKLLTLLSVCLTAFISFPKSLTAQHPEWLQFPSSRIVYAIEEQGNYMWVGTRTGLYRIEKESGSSIHYNNANSPIADNFITSLAAGGDSVMWIGTLAGGLMSFDGDDDWTFFDTTNSPLPSNYISTLDVDDYGDVWVGSGMFGYELEELGLVLRFNGTDWTIYEELLYPLEIIVQDTNLVWLRRGEEGPTLVKFNGDSIVAEYDPSEWTQCDCFEAFAIDSLGNKWLASDNLTMFNDTTFVSYTPSNIPPTYFFDVAIDNENDPWVSTFRGIGEFSNSEWTFYNLPDSTTNHLIFNLEVDEQGNKWVGTYGQGLYKYDTVWNSLLQGLPFGFTTSVVVESNGNVWAGSNDGLARYDGIGWVLFDTSNSLLPDDYVLSLAIEDGHIIWAGTEEGGLVRIEGENWQVYDTSFSPIPHNFILSIAVDSAGVKWLTHGDYPGLTSFDDENWVTYTDANSGLPYNNVLEIHVDQDNNKWMNARDFMGGSPPTLTKYDDVNWTTFLLPEDTMPGFVGVESFAIDTNGSIWVSTNYWHGIFDGSDVDILEYRWLEEVYIDSEGTKWSNYGGLSRYDSTGWTIFNTTNSGLPDNEVNAMTDDGNGTLWIATSSGVAAYNPEGFPVKATYLPAAGNLNLYPNPAGDHVNIQLLNAGNITNVRIYDLRGSLVGSSPVNGSHNTNGTTHLTIDAKDLKAGLYMIVVETEQGRFTAKMLKK